MYGYGSMNPKHVPRIDALGWGEPPQYYPSCSCGWTGISIDTYPEESLNRNIKNHPQVQQLLEKYNLAKIVRKPKEALGTENDAIVQVLHHIDYDPIKDKKYHTNVLKKVLEKFNNNIDSHNYSQTLKTIKELELATEDMIDVEKRIDVFENYQLNIESFDPEIYAIYQRVLEDLTISINKKVDKNE